VEGNLGQRGPSGRRPPPIWKGAELERGRSWAPPPLGRRPKGDSFPLDGSPPSPLNLYILGVLATIDTQVLVPPLIHLVHVLVGPS
jgi:hypothetical protein